MVSARLGHLLGRLRESRGLSGRQLASKVGVVHTLISRVEKGQRGIGLQTAKRLAEFFEVDVQIFLDVLDLERLESAEEIDGTPSDLCDRARDLARSGDYADAYVYSEHAVEALEGVLKGRGGATARTLLTRAFEIQAIALQRLGKPRLAEFVLREAIRLSPELDPETTCRVRISHAMIVSSLGEYNLALMDADHAHRIATEFDLAGYRAMALHVSARVEYQLGHYLQAREHLHEAIKLYCETGNKREELRARIGSAGTNVKLGKPRTGIDVLNRLQPEMEQAGGRLQAARWTTLGEAYFVMRQYEKARQSLRKSDHVLKQHPFADLEFINEYTRWKIAKAEGDDIGEKSSFKRLKNLDRELQDKFRERDEFTWHRG